MARKFEVTVSKGVTIVSNQVFVVEAENIDEAKVIALVEAQQKPKGWNVQDEYDSHYQVEDIDRIHKCRICLGSEICKGEHCNFIDDSQVHGECANNLMGTNVMKHEDLELKIQELEGTRC